MKETTVATKVEALPICADEASAATEKKTTSIADEQPSTIDVVEATPATETAPTAANVRTLSDVSELNVKWKSLVDWNGLFTLKKHTFPTKFYYVAGNRGFKQDVFSRMPSQQLQIQQRLRLDSTKLDDFERRLNNNMAALIAQDEQLQAALTFSIYVALPAAGSTPGETVAKRIGELQVQERFNNLITYLDQKGAAGVISVPSEENPIATVHLFTPNSQFSTRLLDNILPGLAATRSKRTEANNDFLLIVLLKIN